MVEVEMADGQRLLLEIDERNLGVLLAGPRNGRVGLRCATERAWRWVDLAEVRRVDVLPQAA